MSRPAARIAVLALFDVSGRRLGGVGVVMFAGLFRAGDEQGGADQRRVVVDGQNIDAGVETGGHELVRCADGPCLPSQRWIQYRRTPASGIFDSVAVESILIVTMLSWPVSISGVLFRHIDGRRNNIFHSR